MAPKRKRMNVASTTNEQQGPADIAQQSSREASSDDIADPAPDQVRTTKEDQNDDDAALPPQKRNRSSSGHAVGVNGGSSRDSANEHETMEDLDNIGQGENGEAEKMKMDAPPKAGMVDPVGYKTNPPPTGRPVRIYADGVFDLFHLGHMRQLQQAKTAFPEVHLTVGVTGDRETHRRKGLTVLSAAERAESVKHCKWVDSVIEDCPWIVTTDFLDKHKFDYVAHDDIPYGADEGDDIYGEIKKLGKFLVTQRTEGVSTTGIITKIVRDYESYIARQLQRGQSRKELNISWLKKNELDMKRHVNEISSSIKQNWSSTGAELSKEFKTFWMPKESRPSSPALGGSGEGSGNGNGNGSASKASSTFRGRKGKSGMPDLLTSPVTPGLDGSRSAAQSPGAWSRFSVGKGDRDFVAGYAMGLVGSVRGWMQRNRRNLRDSNADHLDAEDGGMLSPSLTRSRSDDNNMTNPTNTGDNSSNGESSLSGSDNDHDEMGRKQGGEDDVKDDHHHHHHRHHHVQRRSSIVQKLEDSVASTGC